VEKDKQGSFPSHVPNQELKETVDHISLERGTIDQLHGKLYLTSTRTSYISRITSMTNAASRENSAMREAMAYMGTINMIRMTILLPGWSVSRRVEIEGSSGSSHTAAAVASGNS